MSEDAVLTPPRLAEPWSLQIRALSYLIAASPEAPVNRVLRGEEWLICGEVERARADFETARRQAERLLAESGWGYIYQSYIDRAEAGLRQCAQWMGTQHVGSDTGKTTT